MRSMGPLLTTSMSYIGQKYNIDLLLLFRDVNGSERTPKLSNMNLNRLLLVYH